MNADELIDALSDLGFDPRAYSGRGMFGAQCVGVDLESDRELWRLSSDLTQMGHDVPAPSTDSMGLGIIAYWPLIKWPDSARLSATLGEGL